MKKLSRNDVCALKQADHILINSAILPNKQNSAIITCSKQKGDKFLNWEVTVASNVLFLHDDLQESNLQCRYFLQNSFLTWHWQTCVGTLVPGDEIELLWLPDAETNLDLFAVGFHADVLKIIIYRQNFRFHYILNCTVGKDHRIIGPLTKKLKKEWLTTKSL